MCADPCLSKGYAHPAARVKGELTATANSKNKTCQSRARGRTWEIPKEKVHIVPRSGRIFMTFPTFWGPARSGTRKVWNFTQKQALTDLEIPESPVTELIPSLDCMGGLGSFWAQNGECGHF